MGRRHGETVLMTGYQETRSKRWKAWKAVIPEDIEQKKTPPKKNKRMQQKIFLPVFFTSKTNPCLYNI